MGIISGEPDDALRLLHWNVHSWTDEQGRGNAAHVAELIGEVQPHVVSLVEVDEPGPSARILDELASRLSMRSVFVPTFDYGTDRPQGVFGNALLTTLPILAVRQHRLTWPPGVYDGTEPSEPRSVVLAELRWGAESVWVGSTHLPRTDVIARGNAFGRLAAIVDDLRSPWLVLGDFNMSCEMWADDYPALRSCPDAPVPTYPTSMPAECIDYCIAPRELVIDAQVLPRNGSDHLPLAVDYRRVANMFANVREVDVPSTSE